MTHPTYRCELQHGMPVEDRPRGCAYRMQDGAVYAIDPAGCGARTDRRDPGGEHMPRVAETLKLLAVGLTRADYDNLRALWTAAASLGEAWRRQIEYARGVAADRARERGRLLRQVRLNDPPPGSVLGCGSSSGVVVRLPDGRGWWGTLAFGGEGWGWIVGVVSMRHTTYAMATDLDDDTCAEVLGQVYRATNHLPPSRSVNAGRSAALEALRAKGLA